MSSFSKRFISEGLGEVGDYRVVARYDRRNGDSFVQLLDDSDGVGMGFSVRDAKAIVEKLQRGIALIESPEWKQRLLKAAAPGAGR
jgi:hypothetical protein